MSITLIALFPSQEQADEAAKRLVDWSQTQPKGTLEALAVINRDPQGELETHQYGPNKSRKGLKVGAGVGALAAILSGGLSLIPTAIAGAAMGGLGGALSKTNLNLTDVQLEELWSELESGQAALVLLCDQARQEQVSEQVVAAGGAMR